ncbi:hypothetical protein CK503_11010 [Aliifodinibius salipaludis]|uniref:Alginate export domain-containing protein n=1 Tax=Fodinibius salipaludis TaxID=2032627 RepID=A0A2A2GA32_9BACT|nr:hypothetical protein [Aliifodinibius salipaludis]PAU93672.1 hypothetical protein CK503_11010 [Aliifodinibius salipaludis]
MYTIYTTKLLKEGYAKEHGRDLKRLLLLVFFVIIGFQNLFAQSPFDVDYSGYVKELGQISANNDFSTVHYDNILHHRIESDWTLSEHFEFRADLRTRLLNGYTVNNTPALEQFYQQDSNYFDLSWVWFGTDHSLMHSTIDRVHLSYINGPWEAHAGRQRINWSRTLVWSPNDLFNNYAYLDFDYEERPGVDALTAQYNWSYASSAELSYQIADSFDRSVIAGMVRVSTGNYDLQFIGGHYRDYAVIGGGWAGYVRDAGFKGEISYFHPEDDFFDQTGHFTATAGTDYMLSNGLYLQGELLYNGGYNQGRDPLNTLVQPPSADNLFIAKSGLFINASYQIHPLVSGNIGFMSSFDRSVFIAIPQLSISITEDADLLLLSQLLKGATFRDAVETPNLFFFRLKWSY